MNTNTTNNTNNNNILGGIAMNTTTTVSNNNILLGGIAMLNVLKKDSNYGVEVAERIFGAHGQDAIFGELEMNLPGRVIGEIRYLVSSPERYTVLNVVVNVNEAGELIADIDKFNLGENRLFFWDESIDEVVTLSSNGRKTVEVMTKKKKLVRKVIQFQFADDAVNEVELKNFEFYVNTALGLVFIKVNGMLKEITGTNKVYDMNKVPVGTFQYEFLVFTNGGVKKNKALFFKKEYVWETFQDVIEAVLPGAYSLMDTKLDRKEAVKKIPNPGMMITSGKMNDMLNDFVIVNKPLADGWDGNSIERATHTMGNFNLASQADALRIAEQKRTGGSAHKHVTDVFQDELVLFYITEYIKPVIDAADRFEVDGVVTRYYDANNELLITVVGDLMDATNIFDSNTEKLLVDYNEAINRGSITMSVAHISETTMDSQFIESLFIEYTIAGRLNELEDILLGIFRKQCALLTKNIFTSSGSIALTDDYVMSILGSKCPLNPIVAEGKLDAAIDTLRNTAEGLRLPVDDSYNSLVSCDPSSIFRFNVIEKGEFFMAYFARKIEKAEKKFGKDSEEAILERDKYSIAVISKNPKIAINGYYRAHALTFEEMDAKIDAVVILSDARKSVMTDEEIVKAELKLTALRRMLKFKFRNAPDAVIYLPNDKEIYALLSGADNDGDKVKIFFAKFITSMLTREGFRNMETKVARKKAQVNATKSNIDSEYAKELANIFGDLDSFGLNDKGEVVDAKFNTMDKDAMKKAFLLNVKNQMSIGAITYSSNKIIALYNLALLNDTTGIDKLLEEMGINNGTQVGELDDRFLSKDTQVDVNYVDELIDAMSMLAPNKTNKETFTRCGNRIFELYQEGAIDATKTGIYLDIMIKANSIEIERLLKLTTTGYGVSKRIVRATPKGGFITVTDANGTKRKVERLHVMDVIGKFEDKLMNYANDEFTKFIAQNMDKFCYTAAQLDAFNDAITAARKSNPNAARGLYDIKLLYTEASKQRSEAMNKIVDMMSDDMKLYNAQKAVISQEFMDKCQLLSNATRSLCDVIAFDNTKTAELLLGIGCSYNFTIDATKAATVKNKFAYNICPEFVYGYFVGGQTFSTEARIVNNGLAGIGETIELYKGVSKDGTVVSSRYSGEVVIGEGAVYVNKSFDIRHADDRKAVVIFNTQYDLGKVLTRNSIIKATAQGVHFVVDASKSTKYHVVAPTIRTFSGVANTEYYVDAFDTIYYRDANKQLVEYTVAYLTK